MAAAVAMSTPTNLVLSIRKLNSMSNFKSSPLVTSRKSMVCTVLCVLMSEERGKKPVCIYGVYIVYDGSYKNNSYENDNSNSMSMVCTVLCVLMSKERGKKPVCSV